jgi:ubiquinone/menaquinone biosynthesis C-methylase UbiE
VTITIHRLLSLLLALACLPSAAPAGEPKKDPAPARYEFRKEHDPDGIGKFYLGREIAQVMSFHGASWLERPEREKEEHTSKLLPPLKIKPGDHVVDLGAGSGYYTFRLAQLVGDKGKVYALDIQQEMLDIIRNRLRRTGLTNVELVKNTETELKLKENSIDLFLMVDVYHELSYPYETTVEMVRALKPGGRLVFVEFRLEDDKVPIKLVHKMTEKQVKKEMAPHALRHVETQGHLPWQHVIIFEKTNDSRKGAEARRERPD